jgi:hypothetical protein
MEICRRRGVVTRAEADFSELLALAADLTAVAKESPKKARQAVQQTGIRTKAQWAKDASGNPFGRQYTATIDYTLDGSVQAQNLKSSGTILDLEIGPNLARYGGKTGRGGLVPSAGIFDDPLRQGGILTPPDRSRRKAEKFASDEMEKGITIALDQILTERGL